MISAWTEPSAINQWGCQYIENWRFWIFPLVTCSKDKFIRVWDLDTQHCLQIIGGLATTTSGRWVLILARKFWCLTWPMQSCGCSKSGNQLKRVKIGTNGMHFVIDLLL